MQLLVINITLYIMKTHRFIGDFRLKIGDIKLEDKDFLNQFRNVLKLKIGETVVLCDGNMNEGMAEIKEYGEDFIRLQIKEVGFNINEPERRVILYCSVLKRENFELVVQKATEAGVEEIVPMITERTIKLNIRLDRLEKIIREAAEQSGRGRPPVIREPVDFQKKLESVENNQLNILFHQSGVSFDRAERLDGVGRIGVWIGPEGGWTDKEIELARRSGFKIINLGKLTLRAETAAIIGTYLIIHNSNCRRVFY